MTTKQPFNWPALLVGILALFAFILSYASLRELALANGVGSWLSYLWPLLLDFAMIVTSTAILRASQRGERVFYAWLLTGGFALLATFGNILDVTRLGIPPVVIAAGVKALAPVALFLAFELLMSMIRADVQRANAAQSLASLLAQVTEATATLTLLQAEVQLAEGQITEGGQHVADLEAQALALRAEVVTLTKERDSLAESGQGQKNRAAKGPKVTDEDTGPGVTERREQVLALLSDGLSGPKIAARLGVSYRTVKRDKEALNGRVTG